MLNLTRSGSIADVIAEARSVPARVIPYAAAAALTRCAVAGQVEVKRVMPEVFKGPTRYTLNALRVVPATKDKLLASVAVKDQAGQGATRPESYLLPGVEGGKRSEKRFEKALRYSGMLKRGEYAVPGAAAKLDAAGNVSRATVNQVLNALKGTKSQTGKKLKNALFVGTPSVGFGAKRRARAGAQAGIYRREGKRLRPLFIFTSNAPDYRQRLDFDGVVSAVVRARFAAEFERAAQDILSRPRK
jgi:hypothetical protein